MKVHGKTFVVTGGGNGIGRELVLLLLKKGSQVAAIDISETALQETKTLAGSFNGKLSTHVVNIVDRDAVNQLPDAIIKQHGMVDGIINNAGIIQKFVRINDLDINEIERVFNVNFWGLVNVTKSFLPHLLKRPEAHIINTSSMGGFLPVPGQTAYGASKAAVKLFSEGLNSELLDTNVHVSVVFPGATATNISANSGVGTRSSENSENHSKIKMTLPSTAAEIIVDGIEKNKYHIFVGSDSKLMNFFSRLIPERAAKIIYSQMKSLLGD